MWIGFLILSKKEVSNVTKMTQVIFGGSMALYVDDKLAIYRKAINYDDIMRYLLESIHKDFEPIQTIWISDYSTFWDKNKDNHIDLSLDVLKSKLDLEYDSIY